MLKAVLSGSRYLVLLGVAGTLLAAVVIHLGSAVLAVRVTIELFSAGVGGTEGIKGPPSSTCASSTCS